MLVTSDTSCRAAVLSAGSPSFVSCFFTRLAPSSEALTPAPGPPSAALV